MRARMLAALVLGAAALASLAAFVVRGEGGASALAREAPAAAAPERTVLLAPRRHAPAADAVDAEGPDGERVEPHPASAGAPHPGALGQRQATRASVLGSVRERESGAPVAGARLSVLAGAEWLAETESDARGRFALLVPPASACELVLTAPDGFVVRDPPRALGALAAGARLELELVLERWPPPVAGELSGMLVDESGPWLPETAPDPSTLVLDLVSLEAPRVQRRGTIERVPVPERDELELRFRFEDVPRGSYELVLSSLDARAWQPRSLVVAPPARGLVFTRSSGDDAPPLAFRVLDALTLEELDEWVAHRVRVTTSPDNGVLLHTGPLDFTAFPEGARFEWSVTLEGYASAFGDERAFHLEGTGSERRRVAELHLARGWATRVLALGGAGTKRPLAGVSIACEGELIGSTDASGSLLVQRAERPALLEARYLDWHALPDPRGAWETRPERTRAGLCVLLLEPPAR